MSVSASQCSKGCESGWTVYLNESWSLSHEEWHSSARGSNPREDDFHRGRTKVEGEEGENLSMVSDASSGPPFREVEDNCSNESFSSGKRRSKNKDGESGKREQHLNYYYEDTACSTHLKCTEKEKTGSRHFHYRKNSAPADKANSGKKGGLKNRKGA